MKLPVERLTHVPSAHHFAAPAGWWEKRVQASASKQDPSPGVLDFDVDASIQGADVHLSGSFSGQLEMQCGRCLKRYRAPLADTFRVVLAPAGDRVLADPESAAALARDGMSLGDDFDAGWFRGPELRLETYLAEVVSLALPIQPLCSEDCAGLCPQCGCDRNDENCDCRDSKPESPFAVLAALRGGSGQGRS